MAHFEPIVLTGTHCTMEIARPAARAVTVRISGVDTGQFGCRPFAVLDELIATSEGPELFIDARDARGPSIEVSAEWAAWLLGNRRALRRVHMLTRSRLVRLTADFVRRFTELGNRMQLFTEAGAFDAAFQRARCATPHDPRW